MSGSKESSWSVTWGQERNGGILDQKEKVEEYTTTLLFLSQYFCSTTNSSWHSGFLDQFVQLWSFFGIIRASRPLVPVFIPDPSVFSLVDCRPYPIG